ncbi:BTB/POZ and MATH domain-containing protein 2 [Rhynchospora pubera]|uniref:BTB/POZ and MATH domain-containing protein 2 n=1 Tax=Rhynchospora pubera TaxID=906938 RepID=A0AAV8HQE0_9POAL|nr:BTB/POZ and MATH domain-containing protein 2 [Rhynchospora pubera]
MSASVVDTREPETQSAWYTQTRTGSHLFKVTGYSLNKGIGASNCITSSTFTLCGYDWNIRYYPDGKYITSTDYLDFDLCLRSKDISKCSVKLTLSMLGQTQGTPFIKSSDPVTLSTGSSPGFWYFMKRKEFEASEYLKNDSFTIRFTVSVIKGSPSNKTNCDMYLFSSQPSNLRQQLTFLLEQGDGKDVSFDVGGVTFDAHRCVLSARSPVFRAELFGPMKMSEKIEIKDMDPSIFKSMLHYIYSDSIPELEKVRDNKDASIALAQHLLVAADRYGLERLKHLCEIKIYEFIDANNVATSFTLAKQHNCSELKAACLKFIKRPEVLAAVMQTEGFEHMIKSCPTIIDELRSKNP